VVGFWLVLELGDIGHGRKLGKNTQPNHGGHHRPMAAMVPSPWHRHIKTIHQHAAQQVCVVKTREYYLKLENIIVSLCIY
jgi:hypothetical protein